MKEKFRKCLVSNGWRPFSSVRIQGLWNDLFCHENCTKINHFLSKIFISLTNIRSIHAKFLEFNIDTQQPLDFSSERFEIRQSTNIISCVLFDISLITWWCHVFQTEIYLTLQICWKFTVFAGFLHFYFCSIPAYFSIQLTLPQILIGKFIFSVSTGSYFGFTLAWLVINQNFKDIFSRSLIWYVFQQYYWEKFFLSSYVLLEKFPFYHSFNRWFSHLTMVFSFYVGIFMSPFSFSHTINVVILRKSVDRQITYSFTLVEDHRGYSQNWSRRIAAALYVRFWLIRLKKTLFL